jgi:hypothetical protein
MEKNGEGDEAWLSPKSWISFGPIFGGRSYLIKEEGLGESPFGKILQIERARSSLRYKNGPKSAAGMLRFGLSSGEVERLK